MTLEVPSDRADEQRARVRQYEEGLIGGSVKRLSLRGKTPALLQRELARDGFVHRRSYLGAERGATGEALWRRHSGDAARVTSDPDVVTVDLYVHEDGGVVRVYPRGDPALPVDRGPAPWAYKAVLLRAPTFQIDATTRRRTLGYEVLPTDEACRVTEEGFAIPRSPRRVHGMRHHASSNLKSFLFAREVTMLGRTLLAGGDDAPAAKAVR